MIGPTSVASPPARPLVIYDGDCGFCALWIARWRQTTRGEVDYQPAQDPDIARRFPEIPAQSFATAVALIDPDGRVTWGAEAALRALARNPRRAWLLGAYRRWPALARLAEFFYRFVADHRGFFSALTHFAYGRRVERPSHVYVRWLFLRALGLVYLTAILSLWTQIDGLVGGTGLLPADRFMAQVSERVEERGIGWERYHLLPTFGWWSASDASLHAHCAAGVVLSLLLVAGIAPAPCLILLWMIYLSLSGLGREFLSFQWDILLLETGFLAIFLASWRLWPGGRESWTLTCDLRGQAAPSQAAVWLLRLLLFKLMVQSGWVKLLSGDETWRSLTALTVHYESQPLPTWIGWYAHQLPLWFQKFSCLFLFGVELVVPLFIFAPRRLRIFAAGWLAVLQVFILLTGNYAFFNWMTLALCLVLLDDFALERFVPKRWRRGESQASRPVARAPVWPYWAIAPLAAVVIAIYGSQLVWMFGARPSVLAPVAAVHDWLRPFRTFNSYGLFAVMTTTRPENIIEGSEDGVTWQPYGFKYKPGDVHHRPGFVAPHQPRLDWQMWFAALGHYRNNPWLVNLAGRLVQGEPDVLALLEENPFPDGPPRHVRARLYEYRFTSSEERRETGAWWLRELKGDYMPTMTR